jgi:hypothetical protein
MKPLLFAVIIGTVAMLGTPAAAHVVQATSSLSLTDLDVNDKPQVEQALKTAVDQVLKSTIAFQPTLVTLTDAQVIGERLYFRVLIADEDGERTLAELTSHTGDGPDTDRPTKVRTTL